MEQEQSEVLHDIAEKSQDGVCGLKLYDFAKATKKDVTRERLFVSGASRSFVPACKKAKVVTLEAEDVNCLMESLYNYSGYLHGAMERCPDTSSAYTYNVRLSFVEGLILKLTH